jgi:hypothetical protein
MDSVTSVTIALGLAQQMAATHQPDTGQLQADSLIAAADVVSVWFGGMPESVDFFDMPAWDKDSTPGNQTDLIHPDAIGCTLAGMSFLCSRGISLSAIELAVQANPYLVLSNLYSNLWGDFWTAWHAQAPKPNNDPFNAWGVQWPQPVTIEQRILAAVKADMAAGKPDEQICADIQALLTAPAC